MRQNGNAKASFLHSKLVSPLSSKFTTLRKLASSKFYQKFVLDLSRSRVNLLQFVKLVAFEFRRAVRRGSNKVANRRRYTIPYSTFELYFQIWLFGCVSYCVVHSLFNRVI